MLRHFAYGVRDFEKFPDISCVRYNWIFLISFDNRLVPIPDTLPAAGEWEEDANFFIIPPQVRYIVQPETPRCHRAIFHFAYVGEILQNEILKRGIFSKRLNQKSLAIAKHTATDIRAHFLQPTVVSELYYEMALLRLTMLALDGLEFEKANPLAGIPRERVTRAMSWYAEHIRESPSFLDVASNVRISTTQLRRDFHKILRRGPKNAFSRFRMQKARQLLANTSWTLEQICEECGYLSATDFCRAFRRLFGITPNHWRRELNESGRVDGEAIAFDENSLIEAAPRGASKSRLERGNMHRLLS